MPLSNPWTKWEPHKPPNVVGVYELGHITFGEIRLVYIGKGIIDKRIRAHNRDGNKRFEYYRCIRYCDRKRAGERERAEQRKFRRQNGNLPTYNKRVG